MIFLYPFIHISRKLSLRAKSLNDEGMKKQIKKEVMVELQPNIIINSLFSLIFSLEVPLFNSVTFPFGSSLLGVAVKGS